MNAEIEVQSNMVHALPTDAIVSFESKQYVFVEKNKGDYEMREVKTGNTENGYTAITLNDSYKFSNSTFVTKGAYSLLMKMKNTSDE